MSIIFPPVLMGGATIEATSFTYRTRYAATATTTNHTISNVAIGNAPLPPNRRWVVVMLFNGATSATLSNVSMGGFSGSQIYSGSSTAPNSLVTYWRAISAEVPSGTTATISFSSSGSIGPTAYVWTLVNCNGGTVSDSADASGTGAATLNIDCPAEGVVLGIGRAGSSSGSTITNAPFANLTTYDKTGLNIISSAAGNRFATAQTNLNVTYDPVSTGTMAQCGGMVLAFPPY